MFSVIPGYLFIRRGILRVTITSDAIGQLHRPRSTHTCSLLSLYIYRQVGGLPSTKSPYCCCLYLHMELT